VPIVCERGTITVLLHPASRWSIPGPTVPVSVRLQLRPLVTLQSDLEVLGGPQLHPPRASGSPAARNEFSGRTSFAALGIVSIVVLCLTCRGSEPEMTHRIATSVIQSCSPNCGQLKLHTGTPFLGRSSEANTARTLSRRGDAQIHCHASYGRLVLLTQGSMAQVRHPVHPDGCFT